MKSHLLTALAGASLLLPALLWLKAGESTDSVLYPHPALVLIPMFFGLRWAAFAVPTMLFFAWNPKLFRGEGEVPTRSVVLLIIMTLLTVGWFGVGWEDGVAIQGIKYNYTVLTNNILLSGMLWLIFGRSRKSKPSFQLNLLFHWLLFAWLAWYAFPFFGEMI